MTAVNKLGNDKISVPEPENHRRFDLVPYIIILSCALVSTFICTSGWQTGLRATLLGTGLLAGIFASKRLCSATVNWKVRLTWFIPLGTAGGLLGALLILAVEYFIGSPSPEANPYHQNSINLLWICPLYGFFISLCYSLAFNLSRTKRFFIVAAGAALANIFCLTDLAFDPVPLTFLANMLKVLARYYLPCLGNSLFYVFLFNVCADSIYKKTTKKQGVLTTIAVILLFFLLAYFGFIFIGAMTLSIKPERFLKKHRNTVFESKMQGIIILPKTEEYFVCREQKFFKLPKNHPVLEDKKQAKQLADKFKLYPSYYYWKDNKFFARKDGKLLFFTPPYTKGQILLKKFEGKMFCVSPEDKFVAYYRTMDPFERKVFCIMELKSKKVLAVKWPAGFTETPYWLSDSECEELITAEKKQK